MLKLVLLVALAAVISARPNSNIGTQNVVTVPPNCPRGQEWINGQCREVWRREKGVFNEKNVITVPPNCPPGQELINGQCRDVWKIQNVVTAPLNCPEGQELINGECRDVWLKQNVFNAELNMHTESEYEILVKFLLNTLVSQRITRSADEGKAEIQNRNIISVPNQCPNGQRPDGLGICRPIFW